MEIESYGGHNKFLIEYEDSEVGMCLLAVSYGLQRRIVSASTVDVLHHTNLIAQSWMKILDNTISTGTIYRHIFIILHKQSQ